MASIFLDSKHRLVKFTEQAVPPTPASNTGTLYLSSITGDLSIKKDTGAVIDLEDHDALTNYVSNEHIDHTAVLIQGSTNSGINVDSGTASVDLTAGTKQISLNVNNLATAVAIDANSDTLALYDNNIGSTTKSTIQNILNAGSAKILQGFYNSSEGESSMSSTTPAQKLRLTFTSESADYIIQYSAEYSADNNNREVLVRLQEDDTITHALSEASGAAGTITFSGFVKTTLTAGSHDFDIDYFSSQNGRTVRISRARIFAYQVLTP